MNYFLLINLVAFLFCSCGLGSYKDLENTSTKREDIQSIFNSSSSYIFKSKLQYADNKFGGLLLVKLLGDESIRLTLTPQIGPKVFDFEFTPDNKFVVHYCIQQMNRPIVLKMIENDLRLLFLNPESIKKKNWLKHPTKNHLAQKVRTNKMLNYYFLDTKTDNLANLESSTKLGRKKVVVSFHDFQDKFPFEIDLVHQNIPLTLNFKVIKRKKYTSD